MPPRYTSPAEIGSDSSTSSVTSKARSASRRSPAATCRSIGRRATRSSDVVWSIPSAAFPTTTRVCAWRGLSDGFVLACGRVLPCGRTGVRACGRVLLYRRTGAPAYWHTQMKETVRRELVRWARNEKQLQPAGDELAVEEPLEIRVGGRPVSV